MQPESNNTRSVKDLALNKCETVVFLGKSSICGTAGLHAASSETRLSSDSFFCISSSFSSGRIEGLAGEAKQFMHFVVLCPHALHYVCTMFSGLSALQKQQIHGIGSP